MRVSRKWQGNEKFYQMLLERGTLGAELQPVNCGPFVFYLDCFFDLCTCRDVGMGLGPIPITAIWQYADRYDLGDFFCDMMRMIDNKYIQMTQEENEEESKKGK